MKFDYITDNFICKFNKAHYELPTLIECLPTFFCWGMP